MRRGKAELEELIAKPEIIQQVAKYRAHSRELGTLSKKVGKYEEYLRAFRELSDNEELSRASGEDPAIRQLAKEEMTRLEPIEQRLVDELTEMVLVEDQDASKNVIMEIRAGTGGSEAALFAADLYRMYTKYAEKRNWKVEVMDASPTELGGFKEIVFSVSGEFVHTGLTLRDGGGIVFSAFPRQRAVAAFIRLLPQ